MLSGVYVVVHKRAAGRCMPAYAAGDDFLGAVFIAYEYVDAERGAGPPRGVVEMPGGNRLVVVPAVAEFYADGIGSGPELVCDVVCGVQDRAVVAGESRVEDTVADFGAVDVHRIEPGNGYVSTCLGNISAGFELFTEAGCGLEVSAIVVGNPAAAPVVLAHQAGFEEGGPGLYGDTILVLASHSPPVAGAGIERRSGVCCHYFAGWYPSGIPDRGAVE